MKRVLLATTALCVGAGTAVAQDMMDAPPVRITGDAEMGVAASKDNSVRFHTDVNVKFALSGTTDAGVTFGSAVELAEASDDLNMNSAGTQLVDDATGNDDAHGGISVFMSDPDGFGTLTLGDTDGAYDWAMIEVGSGGIRDDSEHGAWNGNAGLDGKHDGQILLWNRDIAAGFAFGASVELDDHADNAASNDPVIGIGGTYSMPMGVGTVALGGGYQMGSFEHTIKGGLTGTQRAAKADATILWGIPADTAAGTKAMGREVEGTIVGGSAKMDFGGDMGGLSVTLNASMMEADGSYQAATGDPIMTADVESTHLGLGLGYKVGAVSLGLNVGNMVTEETYDPNSRATDANDTKKEATVNGVGFDVAYDLGGGATLKFGVGSSETEYDWTVDDGDNAASRGGNTGYDHSTDTNKWSLGVAFAF